tara:strand:+ start:2029 stop:2334 length:306 start_codon:yes stop_codon:yes gene_type:complete
MRKRALPVVTFASHAPDSLPGIVTGREAETLLKLVQHGPTGLTAYDFAGGPPFRLPAYVANLRARPLEIETLREEHDCGWHGRYVLHTPVTILKVQETAKH